MKLKCISLGFILVLSIFLASCNTQQQTSTSNGNETENAQQEKVETLKIYTTLYPLEDFAKKIGGAYVDVESIMPSGADAHTFEPTSKQMMKIAEANAFIYNGLGMEPFAEKMAEALRNEKVKMVEATHDIETIAHEEDMLMEMNNIQRKRMLTKKNSIQRKRMLTKKNNIQRKRMLTKKNNIQKVIHMDMTTGTLTLMYG